MKKIMLGAATAAGLLIAFPAGLQAHGFRPAGETDEVAKSDMTVTPARDWNRLSGRIGKRTETWTLDGPQLNDVTFYGGVKPGEPLVKERSKKRDPLPKFRKSTLLIEVPELLESTYRTYHDLAAFRILSVAPGRFLGRDGVHFTYEYTDMDELTRLGEARAVIVEGELYMMTLDAPRLHYFGAVIGDFRQLADSAQLK